MFACTERTYFVRGRCHRQKDAVLIRYGHTEMAVMKGGFVSLTDP